MVRLAGGALAQLGWGALVFEAPVRRLTEVLSRLKVSGVEAQMIFDERGNEVIAVVIAVLHAHFDMIVCRLAGLFD